MHLFFMASTRGEKEIKNDWPHEEGLTAETQKQTGRKMQLEPEGFLGVKTIVEEKERLGM